jgi:hypothetical protein
MKLPVHVSHSVTSLILFLVSESHLKLPLAIFAVEVVVRERSLSLPVRRVLVTHSQRLEPPDRAG